MNKFLNYVIRYPLPVLAIITLITILLGTGIFKLEFENSLEVMMPKRDAEYVTNEETKKVFGNTGNFLIFSLTSDKILAHEFLSDLNHFHQDIEEYITWDEEKEVNRIKRLDQILAKTIPPADLVNTFTDDPVFQRSIQRKLKDWERKSGPLTSAEKERLKDALTFSNNLKKKELVDLIVSPLTAEDVRGENDTLLTYSLIEKDENDNRKIPTTKEELSLFKKRLLNNPAYEKGIYARDKKTGKITDFAMILRLTSDELDYDIPDEMQAIGNSYPRLKAVIQGIPYINTTMNHYMQNDLKTFLPLVIIAIVIIFFLNFRSIRGVLLPFLTMNIADIWIMGLMGHLGFKLTIMGVCLPPLILAVGSSYSIHILNQYYMDLDLIHDSSADLGLKKSMIHISLTVILAGLTTFVGFFMLITNEVSAIREWGVFQAIGVLFAVLLSVTLIPAFLSLMASSDSEEKSTLQTNRTTLVSRLVDKLIDYFVLLSTKHYKAILVITAIVIAFSIAGLFKIKAETSVHAYFKPGDPVLTSSWYIGQKFGGYSGLNIIIDSGKEKGVLEPEFLRFTEKLRTFLEAPENSHIHIGRTEGFSDFIKTMHMAMNKGDRKFYAIPDKKIDIESYIEIFSGEDENDDGRLDVFEPYVDYDFKTANIFARIHEPADEYLSTSHMVKIINHIETYMKENIPPGYTFKTSGEPKIMVRLMHYIVKGQMMSLFFSLIVVALVVFLLFKNIYAGLTALIPITVAVLFNFGIMGWFGIRLDVATAIIASVTIGIGIDDTIHFLNTYRHFRTLGYNMNDTIAKTLAISGRAIVYTSLALIFGFLILTVSNFKPIILFSFLTAVTMVATTIGALLVLPAVIKAADLNLQEQAADSRAWKYFDIGRLFRFQENEE